MKTLIIYYSRTGATKKVAENLKDELNADIEAINCQTDYRGAIGYLKAGREAMKKVLPEILSLKNKLEEYDLVIVGTPVWAFTVASPVRSFLKQHSGRIKRAAFFRTQGGTGSENVFKEMTELLGQAPAAELVFLTKEAVSGQAREKIEKFVQAVKAV